MLLANYLWVSNWNKFTLCDVNVWGGFILTASLRVKAKSVCGCIKLVVCYFGFYVGFTYAGLCLPFSHPSHSVPPEAAEAGADQRLPTDGGGVHQEPGADEAFGGETRGQPLLHMCLTHLLLCRVFGFNLETIILFSSFSQEERSKVDDLRGTPMSVGTLEEIIDDNHAIVSTSVGSEHYVSILSFVDKDLLEPGCSVLLNHKVTFSENPYFRLTFLKIHPF